MCTLSLECLPGSSLAPVSQPFVMNTVMSMQERQQTGSGVIRSKYRGLSWDKKHQGWRVRIYWSGKQRHVGRFDDDVAAARAYDKAAVYLYGGNAITNFGLEACQMDPTEVSPFIVLAKEQAEQEHLMIGQQRQHCSTLQHSVLPNMMHNGYTMQQQAYLPHQQQQLLQQAYLPQQQQQQQVSNVLLMAAPGADALNMGTACAWPTAAAAGSGVQAPAFAFGQGTNMASLTPRMYQAGHPQHHQQQQQQQVWTPAPGSLPILPQQHSSSAQAMMPLSGTAYNPPQDRLPAGAMAPQYTGGYILSTGGQGMQGGVLAAPAAAAAPGAPLPVNLPVPASGPQLLMAQQQQHQQQQQQQQMMMFMAAAATGNNSVAAGSSTPPLSQAQIAHAAASVAMPQVAAPLAAAVSTAPSAGSTLMTPSSTDLVLHHVPAQAAPAAATTDSTLTCSGIGGPSFVQDMLQGLRYAAVGTQQPAVLSQEQSLPKPQNVNWGEDGSTHPAAASSQWALVPHSTTDNAPTSGVTVAAGVVESSPSFSASSSISAHTNAGFALPCMCATTSPACA